MRTCDIIMKRFITYIALILYAISINAQTKSIKPEHDNRTDSIMIDGDIEMYGISMPFHYNGTLEEYIYSRPAFLIVDGLPCAFYKTNPFPQNDSIPISADDFEKLCPLLNAHTIDSLSVSDYPGYIPLVLEVKTKEDCWIDSFLLNGVFTTRAKKIELGLFVSFNSTNPYYHSFRHLLCKKWKLKNIRSISFCPNGIEVYDKKQQLHTVYVKIETN